MKKDIIIFTAYSLLAIFFSLIFLLAYNQHQGFKLSFPLLFLLWILGILLVIILFIAHYRLLNQQIKPGKSMPPETQNNSVNHIQYQERINKDEVLSEVLRTASTKKTMEEFSRELLKKTASEFSIVQGVIYVFNKKETHYTSLSTYAFMREEMPAPFVAGEGLNGQAVIDKEIKIIHQLPEDYRIVLSGLGESKPNYLYLIPLIDENKTLGLIEICTFKMLSEGRLKILEQLIPEAGKLLKKYLKDE